MRSAKPFRAAGRWPHANGGGAVRSARGERAPQSDDITPALFLGRCRPNFHSPLICAAFTIRFMHPPAIRFERITKVYQNRQVALADVSFEIPAGATVGLLGANGSGKSTAIGIALGLLTPSAGKVEVFGQSMIPGAKALRQRLGFLSDAPSFPKDMNAIQYLDVDGRGPRGDDAIVAGPRIFPGERIRPRRCETQVRSIRESRAGSVCRPALRRSA